MTNFEEYKTKLIEEIKDLPDGSRWFLLPAPGATQTRPTMLNTPPHCTVPLKI